MANILSNEKYSLYFQKVGLLYKRPEIRASLEVILSVFTVAILVFAAIRPTVANIVSLQKKISDQEAVNKKADSKIAQLYNAQNQLNTFGSSLRLFDEAVPNVFSYTDTAKRLEYVARSNDVVIDTMSFNGITLKNGGKITGDWVNKVIKEDASKILSSRVSFSANGKPDNIFAFLAEVENMDRVGALNGVSLTKVVGASKVEDSLKATGQITFYFYSQKQ